MGSNLATNAAIRADDTDALLDLAFACSTGAQGRPIDLIMAHTWFNLAALAGSQEAQYCRTDIADQMTRSEIAEAQRSARTWLANHSAH